MELVLIAGLIVAFALLGIGGLVLYQLILQNGRILMRLEAIERLFVPGFDASYAVEPYIGSLPAGVPAPAISLPDLSGALRDLSEWRGKRVLLVFFDPTCTFCQKLLPSLVALASDVVPGRPVPVLVSSGDREANQRLFDEAGLVSPVLLREGTEVAAAYKVDGTPMSYLIAPDGTIGSEIAVGIQATLILAGEMATVTDATMTSPIDGTNQSGRHLEVTVTLRDGLKEGTTAPVFRLPRLNGGEISLLDYRGKKVVLVFSDPQCEPCDSLAPLLETSHRNMPNLTLLMISRGDPEATRAKVAEHGLSFPVALQRHWEISREYGIFATPTAFLIDEWGMICEDVADGPEKIMQMIARA